MSVQNAEKSTLQKMSVQNAEKSTLQKMSVQNAEKSTLQKMKSRLNEGNGLATYDIGDLRYVQKPLGKAVYSGGVKKMGRPVKNINEKAKPTDRIKCKICGRMFTRSGRSNHNKGRIHQEYLKFNKKITDLILKE
jgi:hypothetical protein